MVHGGIPKARDDEISDWRGYKVLCFHVSLAIFMLDVKGFCTRWVHHTLNSFLPAGSALQSPLNNLSMGEQSFSARIKICQQEMEN